MIFVPPKQIAKYLHSAFFDKYQYVILSIASLDGGVLPWELLRWAVTTVILTCFSCERFLTSNQMLTYTFNPNPVLHQQSKMFDLCWLKYSRLTHYFNRTRSLRAPSYVIHTKPTYSSYHMYIILYRGYLYVIIPPIFSKSQRALRGQNCIYLRTNFRMDFLQIILLDPRYTAENCLLCASGRYLRARKTKAFLSAVYRAQGRRKRPSFCWVI